MAMTLKDLLDPQILLALYRQFDRNGDERRPVTIHLEGPPGVGKSSVVREIPRILSELLGEPFGWNEQMMPNLDAPDVRGFMIPTKDKETGDAMSQFAYPAVIPSKRYLAQYPRGIQFMDEFHQADQLTTKAAAPLLLEGRVGDYQLPKGWWVIAASNRMQDRSGVVRPMMHLINRVRTITIDPDLDAWVEWADANNIHPMGVAYAKQRQSIVFSAEVPSEPRPFCSPRSFVVAMNDLAELAGTDDNGHPNMDMPTSRHAHEIVISSVGEGAASDMFAFFKVKDHLPTMEEILANPLKAKVPPESRLDAAYVCVQMCVYSSKAENVGPIWNYVERLPLELQTTAAKQLIHRHKGAMHNTPELGKWISKHRALIIDSSKD